MQFGVDMPSVDLTFQGPLLQLKSYDRDGTVGLVDGPINLAGFQLERWREPGNITRPPHGQNSARESDTKPGQSKSV